MRIKAVGALMEAAQIDFRQAAHILSKLEEQGLAIYKKKTHRKGRATIHKPS
jgi:predicted transcriptional regulator